jgi:hypothetical protein
LANVAPGEEGLMTKRPERVFLTRIPQAESQGVKILTLRIGGCLGCRGCWGKTPRRCVAKKAGE